MFSHPLSVSLAVGSLMCFQNNNAIYDYDDVDIVVVGSLAAICEFVCVCVCGGVGDVVIVLVDRRIKKRILEIAVRLFTTSLIIQRVILIEVV